MSAQSDGKKSFGKRLVETLARQLSATIVWSDNNPGTVVNFRLPGDESKGKSDV